MHDVCYENNKLNQSKLNILLSVWIDFDIQYSIRVFRASFFKHLFLQVMAFSIMPFLVFLLKFVRKRNNDPRMDERQDDPVVIEDLNTDDVNDKSPAVYRPLISVTLLGREKHEISFFTAIYRALRSPLVKCIHYSVSLLLLLF